MEQRKCKGHKKRDRLLLSKLECKYQILKFFLKTSQFFFCFLAFITLFKQSVGYVLESGANQQKERNQGQNRLLQPAETVIQFPSGRPGQKCQVQPAEC